MNIKVGDSCSRSLKVTDSYIKETAKWSNDFNPIHIDEDYASGSVFGKRIAHGLIALGLLSKILGNELPGNGSILVGQTVKYTSPVYIDDVITASVEVIDLNKEKGLCVLNYKVTNQNNETVVYGEARMKMN